MKMPPPKPSHREQIALFRHSIIGDLLAQELAPGELKEELRARAKRRYRPPGSSYTRKYSYKTLERWYYKAKNNPSTGLLPRSRERGNARKLDDSQRELLLEMRQEHPTASAEMILSEALRNGVVGQDDLSLSTLRRLYRSAGLPRLSRTKLGRREDGQRRRWEVEKPGDLWHGDVCHLIMANEQGRRRILVHGLLDDASRYCVALMPLHQEREQDMLEVFCGALLSYPAPRVLYLDNGACYRGERLALLCQRLGIRLVHAKPYSPEARGKMERFWRTMRQRCTDHLAPSSTIHQTGQALWAWLDADYHRRPHGGLLGETPRRRYLDGLAAQDVPLTAKELAVALENEQKRLIKKNATFDVNAVTYEVRGQHLIGKRITVIIDALSGQPLRASWQGQPVTFDVCEPTANRHRRSPAVQTGETNNAGHNNTIFNPITALLQKAREV